MDERMIKSPIQRVGNLSLRMLSEIGGLISIWGTL